MFFFDWFAVMNNLLINTSNQQIYHYYILLIHVTVLFQNTLFNFFSECDTSSSLRQQVEEVLQQQKEVKREMDRLKTERARQDERKSQLETQIQKR